MGTRTWMRRIAVAAAVVVAASAGALAAGAAGDRNEGTAPMPRAGASSPSESVYVPITPCRIVNTQNSAGKLDVGELRNYKMWGDLGSQGGAAACGIPALATALELTATAVLPEGDGYLRIHPALFPTPNATFLNYDASHNIGNTGAVSTRPAMGDNIAVRALGAPTHVVIDVNGYYVEGLHASIFGNGQIGRGNGVLTASKAGTGSYRVNFDRDVRGCAFAVSVGGVSGGNAGVGYATGTPSSENVNGVYVETFGGNGALADRQFHLTVSC